MPLGVCTLSKAVPLENIYVMLSSVLQIKSVSTGAACGASVLGSDIQVAVGVGSPACTALGDAASLSVVATSAGAYSISAFLGSTTCNSAYQAAAWSSAPLNTCTSSNTAGYWMSLGGLASAAQSYYAPTDAISITITLPAGASSAITLAAIPDAVKAVLIGVVSGGLKVNPSFITITSLTKVGARRARALAAGYTVVLSVNTNAAAVALGLNGFSAAAIASAIQAAITDNAVAVMVGITSSQYYSAFLTALGVTNEQFTTPGAVSFTASAPAPAAPEKDTKPLAIGLGVGLGVGVPVLLLAGYLAWRCLAVKPAPAAAPEAKLTINAPVGASSV